MIAYWAVSLIESSPVCSGAVAEGIQRDRGHLFKGVNTAVADKLSELRHTTLNGR